MKKLTIFILALCTVAAYFALPSDLQGAKSRQAAALLTAEDAKERSKVVSDVSYNLSVSLEATPKSYSGTTTIDFQLAKKTIPLTVDFTEGKVLGVTLNGKRLKKPKYNGFFITLPSADLREGANSVAIEYVHEYSTTGNGLYKFTDPADKKVYVYSNFEPYHANHLFPCFDQPDLKASFTLDVDAPKSWTVVSANRESEAKVSGDRKKWSFPKTKRFSTYIFPLHAGEFAVWSDKSAKIPSRLFARQSLKEYVDSEDWFKITRQGFAFFQKYFDYDYPFEKYDQLIVPDFNWGAMENVGAVTFTESYIPRSKPTRTLRMRRSNTILHEMAHMWFGNLVTMEWWNDLWLNESFATYMANLALAEATEFAEVWQIFYQRTKQWAYWEDEMVTSHPITTNVPNTDQAFANFDGITYGKGASTLKKLAFYIGKENFKRGTQSYFKTFAFKNTTLPDFIGTLARSSKQDLDLFTEQWLKTSGTNTITSSVNCKDDKIQNFYVHQTAPAGFPTLRNHKTTIALYRHTKTNKLKPITKEPVLYSGSSTEIKEFAGLQCPSFINLNKNDNDFVKLVLDENSLKSARTSLASLQDPLDRMIVWQSLWDMVRDAKLDVFEFAELALSNLRAEKNLDIKRQVVRNVTGSGRKYSAFYYSDLSSSQDQVKRSKLVSQWEDYIWASLVKSKPESDERKFWLDSFLSSCESEEAQRRLQSLLAGKIVKKLDQDRRWEVINRLVALGHPEGMKLAHAEVEKDPSDIGAKAFLLAKASQKNIKVKQNLLKEALKEKSKYSLAERKMILRGVFNRAQEDLHKQLADTFYNVLPQLPGKHDQHFVSSFVEFGAPAFCSAASVRKLEAFIDRKTSLPPYALKPLRVSHQEDERCLAVREAVIHQSSRKGGS